jgi:hypothetical protein
MTDDRWLMTLLLSARGGQAGTTTVRTSQRRLPAGRIEKPLLLLLDVPKCQMPKIDAKNQQDEAKDRLLFA